MIDTVQRAKQALWDSYRKLNPKSSGVRQR
jgi:hypothetical protein